ncbi:MAG TPA: GPW/gp25 family protein [Ktedonobacterales bacterium]|nr:GPW/gp25 family protein [Ktedonobacterales bacterium]
MSTWFSRAWAFNLPEQAAALESAGLSLNARGGVAMVSGQASVRQAILLLVSTTPGERVMRPDYGCLLKQLIFSPNDETTAGLAIHYVRRALEQWEPRIDIVHLDASRDEQYPEHLSVSLEYRVRATQQHDYLTFSVNLAGE